MSRFVYEPADDYDFPAEVPDGPTQEEVDAFYADMGGAPPELPTDDEVREMARFYGAEELPF